MCVEEASKYRPQRKQIRDLCLMRSSRISQQDSQVLSLMGKPCVKSMGKETTRYSVRRPASPKSRDMHQVLMQEGFAQKVS